VVVIDPGLEAPVLLLQAEDDVGIVDRSIDLKLIANNTSIR